MKPPQVIEGAYFRDLLAQPAALEATRAWLGESGRWERVREFVQARAWRRVVLTGMGSSFHALHTLALPLIEAGLTPVLIETSELVHYGQRLLNADTLLIAVSQSGRSAETLRLLQQHADAALLAITNTGGSPLARTASCLLLTQAGSEATVSCKTYVTTLLALRWLGGVIRGEPADALRERMAPAAVLTQDYLRQWREHVAFLAARLRESRHLFLTGRGESLAATGTGALIIKESAQFPAEGMSSAAFRHGPMEMLQREVLTVVFSGDARTRALNRQLLRDLHAKGGECEEIGEDAAEAALRLASPDPTLRPLLEILPVQMMTLALAALAGREAGRFHHASKITAVE